MTKIWSDLPVKRIKRIARSACFVLERARTKRHFILGQGHPIMRKLNLYWGISGAPRQRPVGMEAIAFVASVKYQVWAGVVTCSFFPIQKKTIIYF